jgi:hypothetical protein
MVIDDISARTGMCRTWTTTSVRPAARANSAARTRAFLLSAVPSTPTITDLSMANLLLPADFR